MNILNIESATNFSGGVNQVILNSVELKKRGHNVFIACIRNSPVHKNLKSRGFEFIFIDDSKTMLSARIIRKILDLKDIDIVHTHHSKGHKIGLLALMFREKEKLVVQRSVVFPTTNVFKYLNPRVDLFVANSNAVKRVLTKYFVREKKIRVVYSAIDLDEFDTKQSRDTVRQKYNFSDKFVFGVVGNYSDYKGHDIVLEAFSTITNRENALLVFVGKDTEKLEDKASLLNVKQNVMILGFKENAREIIKGFDCLVIPSLKESFPNVALEAFFSKVPVLGTDVGGIPELLDERRGFLCKPEVHSMADALIMVYNFQNMDVVTRKAYEFAQENLTIEKKIDKLEKIYKGLLLQ